MDNSLDQVGQSYEGKDSSELDDLREHVFNQSILINEILEKMRIMELTYSTRFDEIANNNMNCRQYVDELGKKQIKVLNKIHEHGVSLEKLDIVIPKLENLYYDIKALLNEIDYDIKFSSADLSSKVDDIKTMQEDVQNRLDEIVKIIGQSSSSKNTDIISDEVSL